MKRLADFVSIRERVVRNLLVCPIVAFLEPDRLAKRLDGSEAASK
jgi:hypothetical protein